MILAVFLLLTQSRLTMSASSITQDLKYGIIYVYGNPKQTHNLRWFASMIEPMIHPLSLQWVETWDIDHTLIVARRFNVGNLGKYATVQLHLNRYGSSDSYSLLAAVHAFSDCLQDVMDDNEGDVILREEDYSDRNEPPHGKWGTSHFSVPSSDVLRNFVHDDDRMIIDADDDMPQDHTRVEKPTIRHHMDLEPPLPTSAPSEPEPREKKKKHSFGKRLKKLSRKLSNKDIDEEEEIILQERRKEDEEHMRREARKRMHEEEEERVRREAEERIRQEAEERMLEEANLCPDYSEADLETTSSNEEDVDFITTNLSLTEPETIDIEAEEVLEYNRLESEYERDVRDLRARIVAFIAKYQQDPQQVMTTMLQGKVLLGASPGHVLVNGDMKIVLPEYDEMEIKMPAMCRTIYILFMKHRVQSSSGIVLKNIDEYRDEIIDIYSMVKPGANEARVEESVNNLCDPFSEALNQTISRANRCIRNVITNKELAQRYIITGSRGEEYSINLDPELMTLPRAVTSITE